MAQKFLGVNHISLTVRDMDKSVQFYRDMVGLEVRMDVTVDERPNRPTEPYRGSQANRRLVTFDTGGGPGLALIAHPGSTLQGEGILLDDVGITHFALIVPSVKDFTEQMLAKGAKAAGPGFFVDPDGILVQFEEPGEAEAISERMRANAQSSS